MRVLTVMLVAAFLTSATFAQCPSKAKKETKSDEKSESCCDKDAKK